MGKTRSAQQKAVISSAREDGNDVVHDIENKDNGPTRLEGRDVDKRTASAPDPNGAYTRKPTSKQKSSPSKRAAKVHSGESVKSKGKPIYSFFNAATQTQKAPRSQIINEGPCSGFEGVEIIHDDSDVEDTGKSSQQTALSRGSSLALAMRKRKVNLSQSKDDATSSEQLPASQKFLKANGGDRVPAFAKRDEDLCPWTEQYAPSNLTELAVHKRKVADVRHWLETAFNGRRQKVLVLKGAAGTGKTTTISLLARDIGVSLIEWSDPTGHDFHTDERTPSGTQFEEFVGRAGRTSGLKLSTDTDGSLPAAIPQDIPGQNSATQKSRALLVEEFPNTFARNSTTLQAFRSTIAQFVSTVVPNGVTPTPMIMVISETLLSTSTAAADSFTAHRLLGPELITNPYVNVIEFNPIAPTFITKALELVVVKEARKTGRRRTPGPLVLKHLAETGDIRSAVSAIEFLCLRGDEGETWSSKVAFTKPKQPKSQPALTKSEEAALKLIGNRENSIGIFHSVGKVVYNKRTDPPDSNNLGQPPTWLPQHRRPTIPEVDTDLLISDLGTDAQTFVAALHENCALSCTSASSEVTLDSLSSCMDNLSDAELLSVDRFSSAARQFSGSAIDSMRQDEMCLQVAVRGLLFNLPSPVHRSLPPSGKQIDAHRMFYPASLKLWRSREETEGRLDALIGKLRTEQVEQSPKSESSNGAGVQGWKRNNLVNGHDGQSDSADAGRSFHPHLELKREMLMDRLPYMARILRGKRAISSLRHLTDEISYLTRISGTEAMLEDETLVDGGDGDTPSTSEHWTTDRPDLDGTRSNTSVGNVASFRTKKQGVNGKRPALPVESRIEGLVLQDDDIVDD